jgi:hypothetical protein
MSYAPRTIALFCELRHPPLAVDPLPIQRIHNRMFESGAPLYKSFATTADGALLFDPVARPGAASSASFHPDRCVFREELTGTTVDEFAERVRSVAGEVAALRGVPVFLAQVVTLRTLVNPRHFKDSRELLKNAVCGFGTALEAFERAPQLLGIRLVFPPSTGEANAFTLRIESFANDPRSLFLENQGAFGPTVVAEGLEALSANVHATYRFVVERALDFLARFDVRQEA